MQEYAIRMLKEEPLRFLTMAAISHRDVYVGPLNDPLIAYRSPFTGNRPAEADVTYNICQSDPYGAHIHRIMEAIADGGKLEKVVCHQYAVSEGKHQIVMAWVFDLFGDKSCYDVWVFGGMTDYSGAGGTAFEVMKMTFNALKELAFKEASYIPDMHSASEYMALEETFTRIYQEQVEEA